MRISPAGIVSGSQNSSQWLAVSCQQYYSCLLCVTFCVRNTQEQCIMLPVFFYMCIILIRLAKAVIEISSKNSILLCL